MLLTQTINRQMFAALEAVSMSFHLSAKYNVTSTYIYPCGTCVYRTRAICNGKLHSRALFSLCGLKSTHVGFMTA